jgi:hypothetical protein
MGSDKSHNRKTVPILRRHIVCIPTIRMFATSPVESPDMLNARVGFLLRQKKIPPFRRGQSYAWQRSPS